MELVGTVKKIFYVQTFKNGFKKREVVISTEEKYPQKILVEFIQDQIHLLDHIEVNDYVKILINLRGREWITPNGLIKYFNSIQGWRVERLNKKLDQNLNYPHINSPQKNFISNSTQNNYEPLDIVLDSQSYNKDYDASFDDLNF